MNKTLPTIEKNESGFTLLEVILSIALLSTIVMLTINLLSNQISLRQTIIDRYPFDKIMHRISHDISGAFLLPANIHESKMSFIHTKESGNSSLIFNVINYESLIYNSKESNLAKIGYFVEKHDNKNQLIRIVDTEMDDNHKIPADGVGTRTVLIEDLKEFQLKFWDEKEFIEEWDTENNQRNKLPKLVKIIVTLYLPEKNSQKKKQEMHLEMISYVHNGREDKSNRTLETGEYVWQ